MSRETMVGKLIGEAYAATSYDDTAFRPMDPRRAKRLLTSFQGTSWENTETLNRAFGAFLNSRQHRRALRSTPQPNVDEGDGK